MRCASTDPCRAVRARNRQGAGQIDVLVHNGGVSTRSLAEDMAWEVR